MCIWDVKLPMLLDPEIPLSGIQHKGISRNTKQLYAQIFKFSHLYTKKNWKCECSSVASGYVNCGMPICWAVKQLSSFRVWSTQEMLVFPFWKTKLRHKVKQYMQYYTCVALFYIDFVVMYMILKKWMQLSCSWAQVVSSCFFSISLFSFSYEHNLLYNEKLLQRRNWQRMNNYIN